MSDAIKTAYEAAKARVGMVQRVALGQVTALDFQRFAVACGDHNPVYFDPQAAHQAGYPDIVGPPLYLTSVFDFGPGVPEETLRSDGTTGNETVSLPIEGLRLMGAGQEMEFHAPVSPGLEITMLVNIEAVEFKEGRSGAFFIVHLTRKYVDGSERLLLVCHDTFIAR